MSQSGESSNLDGCDGDDDDLVLEKVVDSKPELLRLDVDEIKENIVEQLKSPTDSPKLEDQACQIPHEMPETINEIQNGPSPDLVQQGSEQSHSETQTTARISNYTYMANRLANIKRLISEIESEREAAKKEKKSTRPEVRATEGEQNMSHNQTGDRSSSIRRRMLVEDQAALSQEELDEMAEEREIQQMKEDFADLNMIFEDLRGILDDHEFTIDAIQENEERANDNVTSAYWQLYEARQAELMLRRKKCICAILTIIVIISSVLIVYFFVIKKS